MGLQELEHGGLIQPARPGTAVDGVPVGRVARPGSVEEASQVLAAAAADGLAVTFVGGASKLGLGNPPERADLVLSTERLDQVLEHAAGDLVVRVQGGARLADLQSRILRRALSIMARTSQRDSSNVRESSSTRATRACDECTSAAWRDARAS